MDPFDRYIRVVHMFLPRAERDDIVNELREEYRSQLAEAEHDRGRPLTDDERAALVRQFGHPLATASRYWRRQHLIGPALFPFYWPALTASLALNLVVHAISAAVALAMRQSSSDILSTGGDLVSSTFLLIGVVTVVFAVMEQLIARKAATAGNASRAAARLVHRTMAGVAPALEATEAMIRPLGPRRRFEGGRTAEANPSFTGLIISFVFVAWWLLALRVPSLMFLTAGDSLAWAPAMDRIYPVIVLANLLFLAGECLRRTSRRASTLARGVAIAALLADVMFLSLIITSDYHWVQWQGSSLGGREVDLVRLLNIILSAVMLAAAFGVATRWLASLGRRFTSRPPRAAMA